VTAGVCWIEHFSSAAEQRGLGSAYIGRVEREERTRWNRPLQAERSRQMLFEAVVAATRSTAAD
jgi:hypothetical protein